MPILGVVASSILKITSTPSFDWIATATPSGTGTVTFSSVPSGYAMFKVIGVANTAGDSIGFTILNSNTSNYGEFAYYGPAGSNCATAGQAVSSSVFRRFATNSSSTTYTAPMMTNYFTPLATDMFKVMTHLSSYSGTSDQNFTWANGIWGNNSATTDIIIRTGNGPSAATNWTANTRFVLYGMKEGAAV